MASPRFVFNPAGYRQVLRSDGVRQHLQGRADNVKRAADRLLAGADLGHIELIADTTVGRVRAGGTVIGVPMAIEAQERILGRALDSA